MLRASRRNRRENAGLATRPRRPRAGSCRGRARLPAAGGLFKPVIGSGSRGFRVLDVTSDRLDQLLAEVTEPRCFSSWSCGGERTIDGIAAGGASLGMQEALEGSRCSSRHSPATASSTSRAEWWERSLDYFFNIQLVGDVVIEVNPRISTIVYQEDLNLPYLGLKLALGELAPEELAIHGRRLRPTRRALRYFDQVEWDE